MTFKSALSASIAAPLQQVLDASRLTSGQLSSMTGINKNNVVAVLNGDPSQQLHTVIRVAAALGKEIVLVPESKLEAALTERVAPGAMVGLDKEATDLRLGHIAHGFMTRRQQEEITTAEAQAALAGNYQVLSRMLDGEMSSSNPIRLAMVQRAASLFNLTLVCVNRDSVYVNTNGAILETGISNKLFESVVADRLHVLETTKPKRRSNLTQPRTIDFPVIAEPMLPKTSKAELSAAAVGDATHQVRASLGRRLERLRGRLLPPKGTSAVQVPDTEVITTNRMAAAAGLGGFYKSLERFAVRMTDREDAFLLSTICTSRINATTSKVFGPIWKDGLGIDMSVDLAANQQMRSRITSMEELSFFLQALTEATNLRLLAPTIDLPSQTLQQLINDPSDQAIEPLFSLLQRFGVEVSVSRIEFTHEPETVKIVAGRAI